MWKSALEEDFFQESEKEQEYFSAICHDCIIYLMRRNKFTAKNVWRGRMVIASLKIKLYMEAERPEEEMSFDSILPPHQEKQQLEQASGAGLQQERSHPFEV